MENQFFRDKSLEQIRSPEQLNDYLRVTNPAVWLILTAVILLLAGMLVWSSAATIDSFAAGQAQVHDGSLVLTFDDNQVARNVKAGMSVQVGEESFPIRNIGTSDDGRLFAVADTTLNDGIYSAKVIFRSTQVIQLLFR